MWNEERLRKYVYPHWSQMKLYFLVYPLLSKLPQWTCFSTIIQDCLRYNPRKNGERSKKHSPLAHIREGHFQQKSLRQAKECSLVELLLYSISMNVNQYWWFIYFRYACNRKTSSWWSNKSLYRISRYCYSFYSLHWTNLFQWFDEYINISSLVHFFWFI